MYNIYVYIYIYVYIEREILCVYMCVHIYIYNDNNKHHDTNAYRISPPKQLIPTFRHVSTSSRLKTQRNTLYDSLCM